MANGDKNKRTLRRMQENAEVTRQLDALLGTYEQRIGIEDRDSADEDRVVATFEQGEDTYDFTKEQADSLMAGEYEGESLGRFMRKEDEKVTDAGYKYIENEWHRDILNRASAMRDSLVTANQQIHSQNVLESVGLRKKEDAIAQAPDGTLFYDQDEIDNWSSGWGDKYARQENYTRHDREKKHIDNTMFLKDPSGRENLIAKIDSTINQQKFKERLEKDTTPDPVHGRPWNETTGAPTEVDPWFQEQMEEEKLRQDSLDMEIMQRFDEGYDQGQKAILEEARLEAQSTFGQWMDQGIQRGDSEAYTTWVKSSTQGY